MSRDQDDMSKEKYYSWLCRVVKISPWSTPQCSFFYYAGL